MYGNKYQLPKYQIPPSPGEDRWECELPTNIQTHVHDDRFSQTGAVIWADLFSVTSEVEFPDNTNKFLSQMLHNPLLTLLFVRLFPTSCFVNDFTVESSPRLFFTFESPCFVAFPARLKNDRVSCKKYVIIIETPVKRLPLRAKRTHKPFQYSDMFTLLSYISRHL